MISSTRPACLGNSYSFGQLDPGQKPAKVYQFSQRNMIPPASPPICPPDKNSDPSRRRDPGRMPAEVYPIPGRNIARARPPARHRLPSCLPACLPACPGNFDSLGQRDPVQTPKKFTRSHGCNRSILTSDHAGQPVLRYVRRILTTDHAGQPVLRYVRSILTTDLTSRPVLW